MDLRGNSHSSRTCARPPAGPLGSFAILAALLALALAAALALATPASAGLRTFNFGVVSKERLSVQDFQRMNDAGVRTLRITFNWNAMEEPRAPTFERPSLAPCDEAQFPGFDAYDELVSAASDAGLKLLPVFLGSPGYIAGTGGFPNPDGSVSPHSQGNDGLDYADYKCWVRRVVERWGFGGEYFQAGGDPTAKPISRWQIWNEPNLKQYAAMRQVKPAEYGRLVKATTNTVRDVNPKAIMVLAGMPERFENTLTSEQFLHKLYNVKKIRSKFDVVAMHPYGENYRAVRGVLKRTRKQLREENDGRRPLWITETGYATEGQDGHFLVKTEAGQANQLGKTFNMYLNNRDRFKLGTVTWFSWQDEEPYEPSTEQWPDYSGLYRDDADGTPKPSCNKFVGFTGGVSPCQPIGEPAKAKTLAATSGPDLLSEGQDSILPSPPP